MSDYKADAKASRGGKMRSMGCYEDGGAVKDEGTLSDGFVNGAKAAWENAKWVAGGAKGPKPAPYTGGKDYSPKKD